ncbi:hypothetical protein QE410_000109 [Microbacterium sp. SORGH_AS 1204]|uniref:hypothetical protein n=1 Tax=Microbacterium sp. SORGH_AS_1204 TaxID=3041785 RepID=UPI00278EF3C9|nr:hypothetical protein [Microbacterium sp. SORGH_AS_1204]MDQ1135310.1 hypothetical protein [Microbacterium sp. SORGH_AS_1204]
MNTPTDPRVLAHRLTTIGHALHHRLFAHLHDSGIHPKTVVLLSAVDGRIDAPWVAARLARGGKRVTALAHRGWITRSDDDGWSLTDEGRALLDSVDAERSALLAGITPEQLVHLTAGLDALAAALGIDETIDRGPGAGFRVTPGAGRRGFGPDPRRAFGPNEHRGFRTGERPGPRAPFDPAEPPASASEPDDAGHDHDEHGSRGVRQGHADRMHPRGSHECGGSRHHRRRGEERAFERGFEAGFQRGREAGPPPASAD